LCSSYVKADVLNVADTPTTRVLEYSNYNVSFRFFSNGNMQTKLDFGIFRFLTLGFSWELDNFIGDRDIKAAMPALLVKMLVYSGDMSIPSIAVGYDGQGYFSNHIYSSEYLQDPRGIYIVLGKELLFENLMLNLGVNTNSFKQNSIKAFFNATLQIIPDSFFLLSELDNMGYWSSTRINFGARLKISHFVDLDFILRDCWGNKNDLYSIPNERVFRISYIGRF
jgi:hypothetical protein